MIEVLKQALEALENSQRFVEASANAKMLHGWGEQLDTAEDAITSLRQAIAELESQEPVATVTSETGADITMSWWHEPALPIGTKLFTHPPQRTWQGLTGDEVQGFADQYWEDDNMTMHSLMRAIEAKLKEKNT